MRLTTVLGGVVALLALVLFAVSDAPAPWRARLAPEERAPHHRPPAPGTPQEQRAREAAFRKEEARLRGLLIAAKKA